MRPEVAALLNNLPLKDLALSTTSRKYLTRTEISARPEVLTAITAASLTRLKVLYPGPVDLSDVVMARLRDLTLREDEVYDPPAVLRGRGALFTSLTRLEYGLDGLDGFDTRCASNLGPWSDSGLFSIPTLVDLTVVGFAFTLDGRDGRTWATDVARASLPRLAVFRLRWLCKHTRVFTRVARWRGEAGDAVCESLPAAYAAAGRILRLDLGGEVEPYTRLFSLHFEAAQRR